MPESAPRKPFHESVVDEIARIMGTPHGRASDFESVCTLIAASKIPKGHDEILFALQSIGLPTNHDWLEKAIDSVTEQMAEAVAAAEAKARQTADVST